MLLGDDKKALEAGDLGAERDVGGSWVVQIYLGTIVIEPLLGPFQKYLEREKS